MGQRGVHSYDGLQRCRSHWTEPRVLKSGWHDAAFYQAMWQTILDGRFWRDEIVNRRKDGSYYTEEMTITPVVDLDGAISHFISSNRILRRASRPRRNWRSNMRCSRPSSRAQKGRSFQ